MFEGLAAITMETIATGVALPVAGGVGLWALQRIFSFKRVHAHAEIDLGGNGKKHECTPMAECPKHADFAKLVDDRHATVTKGMERIEARMEKNFTAVFEQFATLTKHLLADKD